MRNRLPVITSYFQAYILLAPSLFLIYLLIYRVFFVYLRSSSSRSATPHIVPPHFPASYIFHFFCPFHLRSHLDGIIFTLQFRFIPRISSHPPYYPISFPPSYLVFNSTCILYNLPLWYYTIYFIFQYPITGALTVMHISSCYSFFIFYYTH